MCNARDAVNQARLSIDAARDRVRADGSCLPLTNELLTRARSPAAQAVYTRLDDDASRARAHAADAHPATAALRGLPVSVKDLFDVVGEVTAAGSVIRRGDAPAVRHACAVARLEAAGAVLLGRTNMSEFAFSGVGINPHHGTPRNPCDAAMRCCCGTPSS